MSVLRHFERNLQNIVKHYSEKEIRDIGYTVLGKNV